LVATCYRCSNANSSRIIPQGCELIQSVATVTAHDKDSSARLDLQADFMSKATGKASRAYDTARSLWNCSSLHGASLQQKRSNRSSATNLPTNHPTLIHPALSSAKKRRCASILRGHIVVTGDENQTRRVFGVATSLCVATTVYPGK
jgi:hypothetical protein